MELAEVFLASYASLRRWMREIDALPEAHWRTRPHGLNSIAWLVWHVARVEDSGLNRLVFDRPQVLDDPDGCWTERMKVPLRHHGTTMTSAEVDDLTARMDLPALRGYAEAVAARTRDLVGALDPASLDDQVEPSHLRRVLFDEGMLRPDPLWKEPLPYSGDAKGLLLLHFGLTHGYGHLYDIWTIRGLLRTA